MILLTGATGKVGRETIKQLQAAGQSFRAYVRSPEKAAELQEQGVETAIGDLSDRSQLQAALQDISKAVLITANGEEQLALERQFTDCCREAEVAHLVKLTSFESDPESDNLITQTHVTSQQHIEASGLNWTFVGPAFFMQNFSTMAQGIKASGQIALPVGEGTVTPTDARDVAEVIVRVLVEGDQHFGQSYKLTGPELLSFHQIAGIFSEVLGREFRYVDLDAEAYRQRLISVGLPEWRANAVTGKFVDIGRGMNDHTTDTIQRLLGRAATPLRAYLEDHRELFE